MRYEATSRENALGWMARREGRACPQRPVRSEQRRQAAQSVLALRVAPPFCLSGAARRLQTAVGMRPHRVLERRKIDGNAAWLRTSSGS